MKKISAGTIFKIIGVIICFVLIGLIIACLVLNYTGGFASAQEVTPRNTQEPDEYNKILLDYNNWNIIQTGNLVLIPNPIEQYVSISYNHINGAIYIETNYGGINLNNLGYGDEYNANCIAIAAPQNSFDLELSNIPTYTPYYSIVQKTVSRPISALCRISWTPVTSDYTVLQNKELSISYDAMSYTFLYQSYLYVSHIFVVQFIENDNTIGSVGNIGIIEQLGSVATNRYILGVVTPNEGSLNDADTYTHNYYNNFYYQFVQKATGESAYNDGYSAGYDEGYSTGKDDGYSTGKDDGYDSGYEDGYRSGYDGGYLNGETNGYNSGYNKGYEAGAKLTGGAGGALGAAQAIVRSIWGVIDVPIFGEYFTLGTLLSIIVVLAIVMFVVGLIRG